MRKNIPFLLMMTTAQSELQQRLMAFLIFCLFGQLPLPCDRQSAIASGLE